jgi:hypothetical protein
MASHLALVLGASRASAAENDSDRVAASLAVGRENLDRVSQVNARLNRIGWGIGIAAVLGAIYFFERRKSRAKSAASAKIRPPAKSGGAG